MLSCSETADKPLRASLKEKKEREEGEDEGRKKRKRKQDQEADREAVMEGGNIKTKRWRNRSRPDERGHKEERTTKYPLGRGKR